MSLIDLSLNNKVAVITGGSKGIGQAIAQLYAENGADIVIAARGADALKETQELVEKAGRKCLAVPTDVGEPEQLRHLYERTIEEFGGVDILVNNAAFMEMKFIDDLTPSDFERAMRVNVGSAIELSRLCHSSMRERGGGVIMHVASDESLRPSAGAGAYPMTKISLVHLAKQMAAEWGGDGIRVLAISPGLVRTELADELVEIIEGQPDCSLNPLGNKIGLPHEIAGFALLAASPAGAYINGGSFVIDGGTQALMPVKIAE